MDRIHFARGLQGDIVSRIQTYLSHMGFTVGSPDEFVDGDFGKLTEQAVMNMQTAQGLPEHGGIDQLTWSRLTPDPLPDLFERCLGVTAAFEGHGFTLLKGNFDGAGLTFGIIGFTLKHGELQKLLAAAEKFSPGILVQCFGDARATQWQQLIAKSRPQQVAWADNLSQPAHQQEMEGWKDAFARFGSEPVVQRLQREQALKQYFKPALDAAATLNLTSELGIALAFDVHVQNGSFKAEAFALARDLGDSVSESELREQLAKQVADSANPQWRDDVLDRKLTLAIGAGMVHGRQYALKSWGVDEFLAEV